MTNFVEPKIKQLVPVNNWWVKYTQKEIHDGVEKECFYYQRIFAFALTENEHGMQDIQPIDFDSSGYWELTNKIWFYSEKEPANGFIDYQFLEDTNSNV